jgi:hypothetical protein
MESSDELRALAVALLANAKALRGAAEAAHERGRQLKEMARAAKDAATKRRKQAEIMAVPVRWAWRPNLPRRRSAHAVGPQELAGSILSVPRARGAAASHFPPLPA